MRNRPLPAREAVVAFIDLAYGLVDSIRRLTPKRRKLLEEYLAELCAVVTDVFDMQEAGELAPDIDLLAYVLQQEPLDSLHAALMREMAKEAE